MPPLIADVSCDRNSTTRLTLPGEASARVGKAGDEAALAAAAVTASGARRDQAEVVECDPLIRPAARRAAVAFLREYSPSAFYGPAVRFVGVHGLEAVAACPLLGSTKARRPGHRALTAHGRERLPDGAGPDGPPAPPCTVVYTLRDGLSAALHLAHGCADAAAVLVPGEAGDRFAVVTWPSVLDAYGLTAREIDVLALLLARFTNDEVAQRLVVSRATVRAHVRALQRKLGTGDRRAIWRLFAADHGLC